MIFIIVFFLGMFVGLLALIGIFLKSLDKIYERLEKSYYEWMNEKDATKKETKRD